FLEEKTFLEIGQALGSTEAAAKMRVGRALEKLRALLAKRGVALPATALWAVLSTHAASAASPALTTNVAAAVLAQNPASHAASAGLMDGALKAIAWEKLRFSIAAVAVAGFLAGGAVAAHKFLRATAIAPSFQPFAGQWGGI